MTQHIKFGRDYRPDPRDWCYPIRRKTALISRRLWNDRYWIGDQGSTPHCVGYAWAHWLACSPIVQWLDPDGIYEIAQHFDEWEGTDYDGTSVRGAAKALGRLGVVSEYRWTVSAAIVGNTILQACPVVIGVDWYDGMMATDSAGFIHPTGKLAGGHAVVLVGYDAEKRYFTGRNSWKVPWGYQGSGRFRIAQADLQKLLDQNGEACIGVERKATVPKP